MIPYHKYIYLFPPRPETVIPSILLQGFEDKGTYTWQPKLNGSCGCLFIHPTQTIFWSRHKKGFTNDKMDRKELNKLVGKDWIVLVGEYLNKSKKGTDGKTFNNKFVIFDILVHEGQYLLGTTFESRQKLLDKLYPSTYYDGWITKISSDVYRACNFKENIPALYNEIIKIDVYEGFVGKKDEGELQMGMNDGNNKGWQVKARKATKNYTS